MTENKYTTFNTEPMLNKINDLLKTEVDVLLSDFMDRHNLLENTHQQIMNLPSVKYELNRDNKHMSIASTVSSNSCFTESTMIERIQSMTVKIVKNEVKSFEDKLANIEDKINRLFSLLENSKEPTFCCDIKIKEESERENITLEIIDPDIIDDEDSDEESDEDSDEESDEENDDSEEEEVEVVEKEAPLVETVVLDNDVETEEEEEEEEEEEDEEEEEEEEVEEAEEVKAVEETEEVEKEEEELFEIEIDNVNYCTNNEENGFIYQMTPDGDVGEKVGYLKLGEPFFHADEK
jgi:hypothetical protein